MKSLSSKWYVLAIPALFASTLCVNVSFASGGGGNDVYCDGDTPNSNNTREVRGKIVADCTIAGHADDMGLSVIQQPDGKLVATVSTQSFGDSWPTNCYDVREATQDEAGAPVVYVGKSFKLEIDIDSQASKEGYPGHVNAPGSLAGLKNHKVECTVQ